jgi:hypothetical protein
MDEDAPLEEGYGDERAEQRADALAEIEGE